MQIITNQSVACKQCFGLVLFTIVAGMADAVHSKGIYKNSYYYDGAKATDCITNMYSLHLSNTCVTGVACFLSLQPVQVRFVIPELWQLEEEE